MASKDRSVSREELCQAILAYNPQANAELVRRAYDFAQKAHEGQKRLSGEDFFQHPVQVALILVDLKASSTTIACALLHDTLEDTKTTESDIKREFGDEMLGIIKGLTKIRSITRESKDERSAEYLRNVLLASTKDIRILLIKLADRLHNMRTLKYHKKEAQTRIASETLHIYAPIAHKLGIYVIKTELEDLCLRYLKPDVYETLRQHINEKKEERTAKLYRLMDRIKAKLSENKIEARVYGRTKSFYSIYKKMEKTNNDFKEIWDLNAVRVITKDIGECYLVVGFVHELWKPLPGKFKDYIANPKSNGYQSLHTVVQTDEGIPLEVQIRTEDMHHDAEEGIASHWRYKKVEKDKRFDERIAWLKQIMDWQQQSGNASDFIDNLKIDLFKDEIFVFTPKGDTILLPERSTPVDFAYTVHSGIGDHCERAKVNGKLVPLDHELRAGDVIDIITSKEPKPSRNWLKFVRTHHARQKIRHALGLQKENEIGKRDGGEDESPSVDLSLIDYPKTQMLRNAKCCALTYGKPIVGLSAKDGTIAVHSVTCVNAAALDPLRRVELEWLVKEEPLWLRVDLQNRVGALAQVLGLLASRQVNVLSVFTKPKKMHVEVYFTLENMEEQKVQAIPPLLKTLDFVVHAEVSHIEFAQPP